MAQQRQENNMENRQWAKAREIVDLMMFREPRIDADDKRLAAVMWLSFPVGVGMLLGYCFTGLMDELFE